MEKEKIIEKFGAEYLATQDTYHMGVHHSLAKPVAERFAGHEVCLDACFGAGFMALVLVRYVNKIIGVDTNPLHLNQARHNIALASVENEIEIIEGDVLEVINSIGEIDCAFLDPDWAKKGDAKENHVSELSDTVPPADILLKKVFEKTENVCLRLPKKFDIIKLDTLPKHETEAVYQDGKLKFYCIYFGNLIKKTGRTKLEI